MKFSYFKLSIFVRRINANLSKLNQLEINSQWLADKHLKLAEDKRRWQLAVTLMSRCQSHRPNTEIQTL